MTWAERHPIISSLLTFAGVTLLLAVGLAALVLFVEVLAGLNNEFGKLTEK